MIYRTQPRITMTLYQTAGRLCLSSTITNPTESPTIQTSESSASLMAKVYLGFFSGPIFAPATFDMRVRVG